MARDIVQTAQFRFMCPCAYKDLSTYAVCSGDTIYCGGHMLEREFFAWGILRQSKRRGARGEGS